MMVGLDWRKKNFIEAFEILAENEMYVSVCVLQRQFKTETKMIKMENSIFSEFKLKIQWNMYRRRKEINSKQVHLDLQFLTV